MMLTRITLKDEKAEIANLYTSIKFHLRFTGLVLHINTYIDRFLYRREYSNTVLSFRHRHSVIFLPATAQSRERSFLFSCCFVAMVF